MKICKKFSAFEHIIVFVIVSELTKLFRNNNKKQFFAHMLQISCKSLQIFLNVKWWLKYRNKTSVSWRLSCTKIMILSFLNISNNRTIQRTLQYPDNSMIALNSNNSIIFSKQQHFRSISMKRIYVIHLFWYLQNLKFPQFKFLPTFVQCTLPVTLWFGDSWQHDFRFPVATFVYVLLGAQTRSRKLRILRNQKWQVKKTRENATPQWFLWMS